MAKYVPWYEWLDVFFSPHQTATRTLHPPSYNCNVVCRRSVTTDWYFLRHQQTHLSHPANISNHMEDEKKVETNEGMVINVEELDKAELDAADEAEKVLNKTGVNWSTEQNFKEFKEELIKAGKKPGPELIEMILDFFLEKIPYVYRRDEIVETSRRLQAAWKEVNDAGSVSVLESSTEQDLPQLLSTTTAGEQDPENMDPQGIVEQDPENMDPQGIIERLQRALAVQKAESDRALAVQKAESDRALALRDRALAVQKAESQLHLRVITVVDAMHTCINGVDTALQMFGALSQAEQTMQASMATATMEAAAALLTDYDGAGSKPAKELSELCANKKLLDLEVNMNSDEEQQIRKIANAYNAWMDETTSNVTSKDTDPFTWMQEEIKIGPSRLPPPIPPVMSGELAFTQPAFEALLQCLADTFNDYPKDTFSPPKKQLKRNQIIPKSKNRPNRIVDFCLTKPGQFRYMMHDHAMSIIEEVKPLIRKQKNIGDLHQQSFEQLLGHLAKAVFAGMNYFGIGTSTFATGITANLAYISVYKLELTMEADADGKFAKLQLHASRRLPLMTPKCFETWTKSCNTSLEDKKYTKDLVELRNELYENFDDNSIPLGMQVLWDVMRKPRLALFGPDYTKIYSSLLKEDNALLGSGASSVVFNFKNGKAVLKVGIHPSDNRLEHEVKILKTLGRHKRVIDKTALPVLLEEKLLAFALGGVPRTSQGLVLSPKGRVIESFFKTLERKGEFLDRAIPSLVDALKVIHRMRIFHNDVSPKNIIVQGDGLNNARVFLVDFGCASEDCDMTGFVGTRMYAHLDVYKSYPGKTWKPKSEYDFFSLGLSLSWLLNPGETWDMGRFPRSLTKALTEELVGLNEKRVRKASDLARNSGCGDSTKAVWMRCLNCEQFPGGIVGHDTELQRSLRKRKRK
jgi:Protein kinase domain